MTFFEIAVLVLLVLNLCVLRVGVAGALHIIALNQVTLAKQARRQK